MGNVQSYTLLKSTLFYILKIIIIHFLQYLFQSSDLVTSHLTKQTRSWPNSDDNSVKVSAPRPELTSERQTEAPLNKSRRANSFPSPPADPVTIAILFSYFLFIFEKKNYVFCNNPQSSKLFNKVQRLTLSVH